MNNKIIIPLIVIVLGGIIAGWHFLLPNNIQNQLSTVFENKKLSTRVYGQLIDKDGDPVLEDVEIYFIDAQQKPEGEVISVEGDRINVPSSYILNDAKNQYLTNKDGSFDFLIPNGKHYVAFQPFWEPLTPPMNGKIDFLDKLGRSIVSSYPTFGTISLAGETQELIIKIHNNGYESKKESFTVYTVKPGDTLWSISEQYYGDGDQWALIARINDIELLENKSILIESGQIIKIPRKGWYETNEVAQNLRTIVHSGEFDEVAVYINQEYNYQLKYPGLWITEDKTRTNAIHGKRLLGPTIHLRMNSFQQQMSYVDIEVYDNSADMTLEQFLLDNRYADSYRLKEKLSTEPFKNGGIFIEGGTICSYWCAQHIVFFKNDKIYILSFPVLDWLKEDEEDVYGEIQFILDEFRLSATK